MQCFFWIQNKHLRIIEMLSLERELFNKQVKTTQDKSLIKLNNVISQKFQFFQ